ncbi:MAG TPA: hypothetical protein VNZ22_04300, partial [Bacillota bacterium]|nr:hypothetical protein [Bacillota bacterium]
AQKCPLYLHGLFSAGLRMGSLCFLLLVSSVLTRAAEPSAFSTNATPTLLLVVGAPGESEYGSNFVRQVELWTATAARAKATTISIGLRAASEGSDWDRLKAALAAEPKDSSQPLWLILIGHGTFDGREARFNLRGPDVTASQLSAWLAPFHRPLVLINTASASAPFINQLSATNRVILTATRSGSEQNFTRFGQFLAEALSDRQTDLDKDGQISLLEAFLAASARVNEFYKTEGRLATEHALLDDNGDAQGTPAEWFRGVRAVKKPQGAAAVDGARAHQMHLVLSDAEQSLPPEIRARRDAIELAIAHLRETKTNYSEADYYLKLEQLLSELLDAYGNQLQ